MINTNNVTIQIYNNADARKSMKVHYLRKETDRRKFLQMCSAVLGFGHNNYQIQEHPGYLINQEKRQWTLIAYKWEQVISYLVYSQNVLLIQGEEFNNYNSNFQNSYGESKQLVQYRISLLGMGSVGKSNLTTRWVNNEFFEDYSLTLLDKYTKRVIVGDQQCQIEISDTCGQEAYTSLRTQWMKDKEGLIFTYAVNSLESFEDIKNTLLLFQQLFEKQEYVPSIVIVGNKTDLGSERVISYDEGKQLAAQFKALFYETSAKNGSNVNQMFTGLINDIIQQKENARKQQFKKVEEDPQNQKQGWCSLL
uniref:Ras_A03 protein n=1 Tax=Paramecium tetraurelia TaxID=5888 RepID=Q3SCY4_PARTE|nr:ras_A03 [Paramecium tetraurelia]